MKVAILGIEGSFHHVAACKYFGDGVPVKGFVHFDQMTEALVDGNVDYAIFAIDTSSYGTLLSNIKRIDNYNLFIDGELIMPIDHHLLAVKGQDIKNIKEIWMHPLITENCSHFIRRNPQIKVVESRDTSEVAKKIANNKTKGIGVVASKKAAELYGLQMYRDIQLAEDEIITRFLILSKNRMYDVDDVKHNKTTLKLVLDEKSPSLIEVLTLAKEHGMQLSRIHSFTIDKEPTSNGFYLDFCFDDFQQYCKVLLLFQEKVKFMRVMGEYIKAVI